MSILRAPLPLVLIGGLTLAVASLAPNTSRAARRPDALRGHATFELANGVPARQLRRVAWDPGWRVAAWQRFVQREGGHWRTLWDTATRVPTRIYGSGIAAPGAVASPTQASQYAEEVLARHLPLLAPGADLADFRLVSNHRRRGVRTVAYLQYRAGLPVLGGQVSFRFKADRLAVIATEAWPWVTAAPGGPLVSRARAVRSARQWIQADFGTPGIVQAVHGPYVLPILESTGRGYRPRYETVLAVTVRTHHPATRFEVYVTARQGTAVARRQTLRYARGQVRYNAPTRWPGTGYTAYPARFATLDVLGAYVTTDGTGWITWSGGAATDGEAWPGGPYVQLHNDAGDVASAILPLSDGAQVTWDASDSELVDAQLSGFVHATVAQEFARGLDPDLTWLFEPLSVTVNINDTCNAYSDGSSIHFMRASEQCENTGRLADVVYHEFGHSLHAHAIILGAGAFDEALSEGLADVYSANLTGDPGMGRGFFKTDDPLRHIDPTGGEYRWPDDIQQDPHGTGLIIGGALWDLRKELVAKLGELEGVAHFLTLYYAAMQRSSDIPTTYPEILLEDDDDGDLSNGTPNLCAIQRAFAPHGITGQDAMVGDLVVQHPVHDGLDIAVHVQDMGTQCSDIELVSAQLSWQLREWPTLGGVEELTSQDATTYATTIPAADEEGQTVQYQVTLEFSDGTVRTYPQNQADPWYEVFVGALFPLYCTDFESNPELDGWTHGLEAGTATEGADDWMWGEPRAGRNSGDPPAPYSGEKVYGNDLGGGNYNGMYQSNKINYALSPVVDATGYEMVRLQYRRWLNVEDGYFDQASIYANGEPVWTNFDSDRGNQSQTHHQDQEWRFHDVDLSPYVDENGEVQVRFEIQSDGGLEFGGWTLDDLCIVGWLPPRCGDGRVSGHEECDDGADNSNRDPDACRTNCLAPFCGDQVIDSGEECDDGNVLDGDGCSATCEVQPVDDPKAGCGCQASSRRPPLSLLLLALLVGPLLLRRRLR
jgi:cysteine-rich repeat protein